MKELENKISELEETIDWLQDDLYKADKVSDQAWDKAEENRYEISKLKDIIEWQSGQIERLIKSNRRNFKEPITEKALLDLGLKHYPKDKMFSMGYGEFRYKTTPSAGVTPWILGSEYKKMTLVSEVEDFIWKQD